MLASIKKFFDERIGSADVAQDSTHALHLACAALLFEVARMDFSVDETELEALARALQQTFSLSATESHELIDLAEAEMQDATSYHAFTSLINQSFEYGQKVKVVEMLWQVAFADRQLDRYEEHMVRKVAELLYVSHADFIQAKHRVMDGS